MDFRELSEQLRQLIADAHVPSLAIAAMRHGELVYSEGFGVTSVEAGGQPVTPDTLFRIGSTTKPMVGAVIMRLVEQGRLDLDAPITGYLPWLRFKQRGAAAAVTLRVLLSHTSGLPTEYMAHGSSDPAALEDSLRRELPGYELFSPPGRLWSYSNPGVRLAAHIAERASGKLFPALLQEFVFEPLELTRATCDPLQAMTFPLALAHKEDDHGQLHVVRPFMNNAARYPAGGVISNVLEVVRFGQGLLDASKGRAAGFLSGESLQELCRSHAHRFTAFDDFYGLTTESVNRLGPGWIGHSGYSPPYRSRFAMHLESQAVISMLFVENGEFADRGWTILKKLATGLAPAPPGSQQAEQPDDTTAWREIAGEYVDRQGRAAVVELAGTAPRLTWDGRCHTLRRRHAGIFLATPESTGNRVVLGVPDYTGTRADFITIDCLTFRRVSQLNRLWQSLRNRWATPTRRGS